MSDLTALRDHARKMAADMNISTADAGLWMDIADQIDAYLAPDPLSPAPEEGPADHPEERWM